MVKAKHLVLLSCAMMEHEATLLLVVAGKNVMFYALESRLAANQERERERACGSLCSMTFSDFSFLHMSF